MDCATADFNERDFELRDALCAREARHHNLDAWLTAYIVDG